MNKTAQIRGVILLLVLAVCSASAAIKTVGGALSGYNVWSDTVIVNASISATNEEGDTLAISAGTTVLMSENTFINMANLTVIANGAEGNNIVFKPLVENTTWKGFYAFSVKVNATFEHVTFEDAYRPQLTGGPNGKGDCGGLMSVNESFGDITFKKCVVTNCGAYGDGGAIFVRNNPLDNGDYCVDLYITETSFTNCSAGKSGGAVALENMKSKTLFSTISLSTFSENSAVTAGGAVYVLKDSTNGFFRSNTFTQNRVTESAGTGGAVLFRKCERVDIEKCNFEKNESFLSGAIQIDSSKYVSIEESVFFNNKGTFSVGAGTISDCDSLFIKRTHFNVNTTPANGVASLTIERCNGYIENSIFSDNISGWCDLLIDECSASGFYLLHNTLYSTNTVYPLVLKKSSTNCTNSYIYNGTDTAVYLDETSNPTFSNCHMSGGFVGPGAAGYTNGGTVFTTKVAPDATTFGFYYNGEPTDNGATPSGITMPKVDFYGKPRMVNGRYDIGAVECIKYPLSASIDAASDTITLNQFDTITVPLNIVDPYIADWAALEVVVEVPFNNEIVAPANIKTTLSEDGSSILVTAGWDVGKAKVILTVKDGDFPAILNSQIDTFWVRTTDVLPTLGLAHDTLKVDLNRAGETYALFTHGKDTTGKNLNFVIDTIIAEAGSPELPKEGITITGAGMKRTIGFSEVATEGVWNIAFALTDGPNERNTVYDTLRCEVKAGIGVISPVKQSLKQGLQIGSHFYPFAAGEPLSVALYNIQGQVLYRKNIESVDGVLNVGSRSIAAGCYLLKIESRSTNLMHRLILR